jgi:predicted RNA polymerase sigma factor
MVPKECEECRAVIIRRLPRDNKKAVAAAEDALSEAFASALVEWPVKGCPTNPEAWLLTVARRKTIDAVRRQRTAEVSAGEVQIRAVAMSSAAGSPKKHSFWPGLWLN